MERFGMCTVAQLKKELAKLKDGDVISVNQIGNIKVERGEDYAGYIELGDSDLKEKKANLCKV